MRKPSAYPRVKERLSRVHAFYGQRENEPRAHFSLSRVTSSQGVYTLSRLYLLSAIGGVINVEILQTAQEKAEHTYVSLKREGGGRPVFFSSRPPIERCHTRVPFLRFNPNPAPPPLNSPSHFLSLPLSSVVLQKPNNSQMKYHLEVYI